MLEERFQKYRLTGISFRLSPHSSHAISPTIPDARLRDRVALKSAAPGIRKPIDRDALLLSLAQSTSIVINGRNVDPMMTIVSDFWIDRLSIDGARVETRSGGNSSRRNSDKSSLLLLFLLLLLRSSPALPPLPHCRSAHHLCAASLPLRSTSHANPPHRDNLAGVVAPAGGGDREGEGAEREPWRGGRRLALFEVRFPDNLIAPHETRSIYHRIARFRPLSSVLPYLRFLRLPRRILPWDPPATCLPIHRDGSANCR